ncbi:putative glycosyltransferase 61 [Tanacetum coccineum]
MTTIPIQNHNLTTTTTISAEMPYHHKHSPLAITTRSSYSFFSPKLSVYLCSICVTLFILFHIKILQTPSPSSPNSLAFLHNWQEKLATNDESNTCTNDDHNSLAEKLRESVTFLPLKDLRFSTAALVGHTWFMSSLYDMHEEGEVQYQQFPSKSSDGRILCMKGNDNHDGSWNYYALAYPDFLPRNATLVTGRTFVSYNHYDYGNIWHGLSALVPFVAWHLKEGCALPSRWILYHWGEVRTGMSPWLHTLMEATFDGPLNIEKFDDGRDMESIVCYEESVVMRHNEGGMSREKRMGVYDLIRCKARTMCGVEVDRTDGEIGLTLFMRTGPRSFRNETAVVEIFERECKKIESCRLTVAYSNNLTVCEQVKLMGSTDILVSPHGAQLTNLFLMDRNSSVMEFFPKGWLKLAGVGQLVYQWIASWSGMKHQGAWRDTEGDPCPFPEDDRRCMSIFKNGKIGYNATYFTEWASKVLNEVKMRKLEEASKGNIIPTKCACG